MCSLLRTSAHPWDCERLQMGAYYEDTGHHTPIYSQSQPKFQPQIDPRFTACSVQRPRGPTPPCAAPSFPACMHAASHVWRAPMHRQPGTLASCTAGPPPCPAPSHRRCAALANHARAASSLHPPPTHPPAVQVVEAAGKVHGYGPAPPRPLELLPPPAQRSAQVAAGLQCRW